jgi:hypothetical protein
MIETGIRIVKIAVCKEAEAAHFSAGSCGTVGKKIVD